MARQLRLFHSFIVLAALSSVQAYFLVGNRNILVSERLDPIINPNTVSGHVHNVIGGSNFGMNLTTDSLRDSECTTMPIQEDRSNYWYPQLYFQHKNGSFSSVLGGNVIYYLFNDAENGQPNTVKAFPDNFRMISGDMTLRSYDPSSYAQQAITYLCLDFNGNSAKTSYLPTGKCPDGIRAQINFPMCWDGKNLDSADHKSHVAFPSGGADQGTCSDPNFPVTLPRVFIETYLPTNQFDDIRDTDAMNSSQPFVYAHGDPTGYGYHADFFNGWKSGVLQNVLDKCACTSAGFGDATCCGNLGVFTLQTSGSCSLTPIVDEQVVGTFAKLPGNNPVRAGPEAAAPLAADTMPAILSPAYAYTGASPTATGQVVSSAFAISGGESASAATPTPAPASGSDSSSSSDSSITSGNVAVVTPTPSPTPSPSNSDDGSSVVESSSNVDVASPTPSPSVSESSSNVNVASPTPSPSTSDDGSVVASSSYVNAASPSVQAPPATSPSSGSQNNASSSGDDDDEYEYYCEKRPKRRTSKARRHHNAHKRLTSDDF